MAGSLEDLCKALVGEIGMSVSRSANSTSCDPFIYSSVRRHESVIHVSDFYTTSILQDVLDALGDALFNAELGPAWRRLCPATQKALGSWMAHFTHRQDQYQVRGMGLG